MVREEVFNFHHSKMLFDTLTDFGENLGTNFQYVVVHY